MRKIVYIASAFLFMLSIAACSNADTVVNNALNSSTPKEAKSNLTEATIDVKAILTGSGKSDYNFLTIDDLNDSDSDLDYENGFIHSDAKSNAVALLVKSQNQIVFSTRSNSAGKCFYIEINIDQPTRYGTAHIEKAGDVCPWNGKSGGGIGLSIDQKIGWKE